MSNLQFTLGYKYFFGVAYIMLEEERHTLNWPSPNCFINDL